jgi:hypothetical protein
LQGVKVCDNILLRILKGDEFMNLQKIIDKKDWAAKYMIDEITHIIKTFEKRDPGSKGELQSCEYMAEVLNL